jgi:hypothetical protein
MLGVYGFVNAQKFVVCFIFSMYVTMCCVGLLWSVFNKRLKLFNLWVGFFGFQVSNKEKPLH